MVGLAALASADIDHAAVPVEVGHIQCQGLEGPQAAPPEHAQEWQSVDITTKGPDLINAVWASFMPDMAEGVGFEPTIELPL